MIWADRVAISIVALALVAALALGSPADSKAAAGLFNAGAWFAIIVWIVLRLLHFIGTGRLR